MSLGPVFAGFDGTELSREASRLLRHPAVGGVVLFTRNFKDRPQLRALIDEIRSLRSPRLVIAVDQEGGRVQRFRDGFTALPPLGQIGQAYERSLESGRSLAYRHGWVMATEMLDLGIDLSFAPVLDLDRGSEVIGDRSLGRTTQAVVDLGRHYVLGMHDAGMCATGKHFPGHGSVRADSHVEDVCDDRVMADIQASDLEPFRALAPELDAIMIAHVVYPRVDGLPAGYSRTWLRNCLRAQLDYEGLILSDDIGMHAARTAGSLPERAGAALSAGCDVILACQPDDAEGLLNGFERPSPPELSTRLQALYGAPVAPLGSLDDGSHPEHDRICAWRIELEALGTMKNKRNPNEPER